MLNISPNTINQTVQVEQFRSFNQTSLSPANKMFTRWLVGTLVVLIIFLMLPWTQNIQSKGKVTTLRPQHRPQVIPSAIAGRIEEWHVQEGELVNKGDTIVFISEIKSEYFDPDLVPRTRQQVSAKEGAISSYGQKVTALEQQIAAMKTELDYKQRQLENKILQMEFKLASDQADLVQAYVQDSIARRQFRRSQELFKDGLESRTKLEDRQGKLQETSAKYISAQNKVEGTRNELENAKLELATIRYEYNQKIAKATSDKFSTLSAMYDAEGSVNKLRIEASNYERRRDFYYITAPQDCYITKAIKPGIGETIKEGDPIVSIVPAHYELAVELFVKPMDLPLLEMGQEVRFIFDGWPAFIFSGWPGQSFGTYRGRVVAIDNMISEGGRYRILVGPDETTKTWPRELRPGSGAQGIALLNNVPLWYEVWRRLNGFPPDYYDDTGAELPKLKAPVKSIK